MNLPPKQEEEGTLEIRVKASGSVRRLLIALSFAAVVLAASTVILALLILRIE